MGCPNDQNLCVSYNNTQIYNLTFTDDAGDAIDITGATVYMTCKENVTDDDADALFQKIVTSHTVPASGQTTISLTTTDTTQTAGRYYYDIKIALASGAEYTVMKGRFQITETVTDA